MGLRDRVIAARPVNLYAQCFVAQVAARVTDEQRAEWFDAVDRPEPDGRFLPAGTLAAEAFKEYGVRIGETSIQRHRRRQCLCWQPQPGAPDGSA